MNISIDAVFNVIELKPGHKYLLVFTGITPEQAEQVLQVIRAAGIEGVGVGLDDGESLQVIEVTHEE